MEQISYKEESEKYSHQSLQSISEDVTFIKSDGEALKEEQLHRGEDASEYSHTQNRGSIYSTATRGSVVPNTIRQSSMQINNSSNQGGQEEEEYSEPELPKELYLFKLPEKPIDMAIARITSMESVMCLVNENIDDKKMDELNSCFNYWVIPLIKIRKPDFLGDLEKLYNWNKETHKEHKFFQLVSKWIYETAIKLLDYDISDHEKVNLSNNCNIWEENNPFNQLTYVCMMKKKKFSITSHFLLELLYFMFTRNFDEIMNYLMEVITEPIKCCIVNLRSRTLYSIIENILNLRETTELIAFTAYSGKYAQVVRRKLRGVDIGTEGEVVDIEAAAKRINEMWEFILNNDKLYYITALPDKKDKIFVCYDYSIYIHTDLYPGELPNINHDRFSVLVKLMIHAFAHILRVADSQGAFIEELFMIRKPRKSESKWIRKMITELALRIGKRIGISMMNDLPAGLKDWGGYFTLTKECGIERKLNDHWNDVYFGLLDYSALKPGKGR